MPIELSRRRALLFELTALIALWVVPAVVRGMEELADVRPRYSFYSQATISGVLERVGELVLLSFLIWNSGDELVKFGLRKPRSVDLLLGALMFFVIFGCFQVPRLIAHGDLLQYSILHHLGLYRASCLTLIMILAPIQEEVIFRGMILPRISELTGNIWVGVVLSAGFFGVVHIYQGAIGVWQALATGLLFGICFKFTNRLTPVIVAHVLLDVTIIFLY